MLAPLSCSSLDRGLDQNRAQARRGATRRPAKPVRPRAGFPVLPRAGEACRSPRAGSTFSAASSNGCTKAIVQRALAGGWHRRPACRLRPQISGMSARVVESDQCRGTRRASSNTHSGNRPSPRSSCQRCPVDRSTKGKKSARLRPDQPCLGADRPCVGQRVGDWPDSRRVVAIVDGQIGRPHRNRNGSGRRPCLAWASWRWNAAILRSPAARLPKARKFRRR